MNDSFFDNILPTSIHEHPAEIAPKFRNLRSSKLIMVWFTTIDPILVHKTTECSRRANPQILNNVAESSIAQKFKMKKSQCRKIKKVLFQHPFCCKVSKILEGVLSGDIGRTFQKSLTKANNDQGKSHSAEPIWKGGPF